MLHVAEGGGDFASGDLIRFSGRVRPPRNYGIPGEFDAERHYALKGVGGVASVESPDDILLVRRGERSLQRCFDLAAAGAGEFIMAAVPGREGGILKGLLVGDCGDIPQGIRDAYSRTGVNHILSISGFHVGIIALALYQLWFLLARLFPTLLLHWNLRRYAMALSLPLVFAYMLLSGGAPATARSVIMLTALMIGLVVERELDHLNSLILAALLLLVVNPANLYSVSFQFSFLALWGIMVLSPPILSLSGRAEGGRWHMLARFAAASLAAVAVTLLPAAYYFQQATITGVLSNFFVVPLLGYGGVVLGFAALPLIWLFPPGAAALLKCAALLVTLADRVILLLDRIPLLPDFAPKGGVIAVFIAGLLLITVLSRREQQLGLMAALPVLLVVVQLMPAGGGGRGLRLDFFSVGQGESALLTFADGKRMLIDGGGALHDGNWDPGRRLLLPCLRRMGVGRIDYMVLSHPHPDHLRGLLAVAESLPVGEFWETGVIGEGEEYQQLKMALARRNVPVIRVNAATPQAVISGARVRVLYPFGASPLVDAAFDTNESSMVMRVDDGDFSVLFTGDIGVAAETLLLRRGVDLRATVLKVPHHGSRYSALPEFFRTVSPRVALIGAGYRNGFGLPSPEALKLLGERGAEIYRTDMDGSVTVRSVDSGKSPVISAVKRHFN